MDQSRIVRVVFRASHVEDELVRLVQRCILPETLWKVRIGQK